MVILRENTLLRVIQPGHYAMAILVANLITVSSLEDGFAFYMCIWLKRVDGKMVALHDRDWTV